MKEFKKALKPTKPKMLIAIILTLVLFWLPTGAPFAYLLLYPFMLYVTHGTPNHAPPASLTYTTPYFLLALWPICNFIAWYCIGSIAAYLTTKWEKE